MHALALAAFYASILFLPWFVSVMLAVGLISFYRAYVSVIIGGVILDSMFGIPITALGGISFIYTLIFTVLAAFAYILRRTMIE